MPARRGLRGSDRGQSAVISPADATFREAASLEPPLRGRRILVVEDDVILALDLQETLREAGATVIGPAGALLQALHLVEHNRLDAAVLDIQLGTVTSLPLADQLAKEGIPFIFQTSDPQFLNGAHACVPILTKPLRSDELVDALAALPLA
jgi:CheY-like chemotaxis protein